MHIRQNLNGLQNTCACQLNGNPTAAGIRIHHDVLVRLEMKLHLNVDGWKKPPEIVEKSQPCVGMSIIGKAEENVSKYQIGVASSDSAEKNSI